MDGAFDLGSVVAHIKADITGFTSGIQAAKAQTGELKSGLNDLGYGISTIQKSFIALAGATALIGFVKSSIDAFNDEQRVIEQTNAVLQSTGDASGMTGQKIHDMADEIQRTTPIANDAAQEGMNMLLTFTQLGKENFPIATQAMIDMATAMNGGVTPSGTELKDTAIQLGKAMNDPILGMTALRRVGVEFTESQKEQVKAMVDANNIMGAQKLILNELATEFGGSAAAQAQTFGGQMEMLKNKFADMQKQIGAALVPAIQDLMDVFAQSPGGINPLLIAFQAISSAIIGVITLMTILGEIISTVLAVGYAAVTGHFNAIGGVVKQGVANIYDTELNASKRLNQVWKASTATNVSTVAGGYKQMDDAGSKHASEIAKQLASETQKFQDENEKRLQSFKDRMADIVKAHEDKVRSIQQQMDQENQSFTNSMDDQKLSFTEHMQDQKDTHIDKVQSIQDQIDEETAKGEEADQHRLVSLKKELSDETKAYDEQTAKDTQRQQERVAQMQRDHDQKLSSLQTELNQEQDILNKHNDDVKAVQAKASEDDIDRLHDQFSQENAEAQKQHEQRMKDILTQGSAQGGAYGGGINSGLAGFKPKIDNTMKDIGQSAGQQLANAIATGAKNAGESLISNFINGIKQKAKDAVNAIGKSGLLNNTLISDIKSIANNLPSFDTGGIIPGPIGSEQLVIAHGGETVLPTHKTDMKNIGSKTINQYNYNTINDTLDSDMVANQLAFKLKTTL